MACQPVDINVWWVLVGVAVWVAIPLVYVWWSAKRSFERGNYVW